MKGVFERTRQTHTAMIQKVQDALRQRDDMKVQMEEAVVTKEAVSGEPLQYNETDLLSHTELDLLLELFSA